MYKLRIRFCKTGRAIWISHLDLMHSMQRIFSRAGYRLAYSEGFNPHPLMSIALPLSVGVESYCEILDVRIDTVPDVTRLNSVSPEGIEFLEVYEAERRTSDIKWLEIEGKLSPYSPDWDELFAGDSIMISKKTKRGVSDADIRPMIKEISFSNEMLHAVISAQDPTLNPQNLVDAISQIMPESAPTFSAFKRIMLFDSDMKEFR